MVWRETKSADTDRDNTSIVRADNSGQFWHIVAGAAIAGLIRGISSIVGQAVSGQKN